MKYFAILFLFINTCFAQKVFVKDQQGDKLEGVSVFLVTKDNALVAVTDSLGICQLKLEDNQEYKFYMLGYETQTLLSGKLKETNLVTLKENAIQLSDVNVKFKKSKTITLKNKTNGFRFGESNNIKATIEAVTKVDLENPGFIKEFRLFATQTIPGKVRTFRLAIFKNNNGLPGEQIFKENITGILNKGKLIFNVYTVGFFLEKGSYFMGYESTNNTGYTKYEKISGKDNLTSKEPFLLIKGGISKTPTLYTRWNLNSWRAFDGPSQANTVSYHDMAYELEMDLVN